jgi:HSP20 family protein
MIPFERKNNGIQKKYDSIFDLDRVFESFFNDAVFPTFYSNSGQMRVDIKETEKEYTLEAELPGVKREDISIDIHDNLLTISAKSDENVEEKKDNFIRRERRSSSMSRSFSVDNVEHDKISAKHDNGILTLILPKREESKPKGRKVDIN